MDKYKVKVQCRNCGYRRLASIPKGQLVEMTDCSNCGCKQLKLIDEITYNANDFGIKLDIF